MTVISNKYNYKEGISFLHTIKLSSGVFGKCIEYKGSLTNYIITEFGDVYNIKTERKLKPCILSGPGYYSVNIQLGHRGVYKTMCIHRLIALGYIENKHKYPCVNHIDGNKLNNSIQNLEWVTYSQNNSHAYLLKLKAPRVMDSDSCIFTTHTMDDVSVVCDLLETGFSPKSISEKTGFGIDFVRNIYDGHTWKYITKSKNFSKVILYNKFFNISEIRQMESLFLNGYSVKEVINKMNWEYNELIRGRVRQFKKQCERYWNAKNN